MSEERIWEADSKPSLEARVVRAAEAALADHQYVSAIDVLAGIGLLNPTHLNWWKQGRAEFLEQGIQANPKKVASSLEIFPAGLRPSEARYVRNARAGTEDLRFTAGGDPEVERQYRTHYISPELSERKRQSLEERARRGSGRVGRTAAGRNLEERALIAAVRAAVRHNYTNYDELLGAGAEREVARERVRDRVQEILSDWSGDE